MKLKIGMIFKISLWFFLGLIVLVVARAVVLNVTRVRHPPAPPPPPAPKPQPPPKPPNCPDLPDIADLRLPDGTLADVRILEWKGAKLYLPRDWLWTVFNDPSAWVVLAYGLAYFIQTSTPSNVRASFMESTLTGPWAAASSSIWRD